MSAIGAVKAGEALGVIAAAVEFLDDLDGIWAEGPLGFSVALFVTSTEFIPPVVDDLPEGRGSWAARAVDGGHTCPYEQKKCFS